MDGHTDGRPYLLHPPHARLHLRDAAASVPDAFGEAGAVLGALLELCFMLEIVGLQQEGS